MPNGGRALRKDRKIILLGDSAFAEVAYEYFTHDSPYEVVAFGVERAYLKRETLFGLPVVPFETLEQTYAPGEHSFFAATVYTQLNRLRTRLYVAARAKGYAPASYVSPRAFVWPNVRLGEHCFIFENNVVQPFVTLGANTILWSGNHIGHHSTIGDHCFISSHVVISGHCEVGESCFFGVNCAIGDNVKIARDCVIGAGAVVVKHTEPGKIYRGDRELPARVSSFAFFQVKEAS
jgi:sugar O-acyltransferase (sialic acid O-acetyltransferase NeuD family)